MNTKNLKILFAALFFICANGASSQGYEPFSDGMSNNFFGESYDYEESGHQSLTSPMMKDATTTCIGRLCPMCGSDYLDSHCLCSTCGYDGSGLSTVVPAGNPVVPMLIMVFAFGTYLFFRNRLRRMKEIS